MASAISPYRIRRIAVETKATEQPVAGTPANSPTFVPAQCDHLLSVDFVHNGEVRGRAGQKEAVRVFLDGFDPLTNATQTHSLTPFIGLDAVIRHSSIE